MSTIEWNPPEPTKSGGEVQTSKCGRFRLYESVISGYAVGYKVDEFDEFSKWRPIDPVGSHPRWHSKRKDALRIVESFAKANPMGQTNMEGPTSVPFTQSHSNLRSNEMSDQETKAVATQKAAATTGARKKRKTKPVASIENGGRTAANKKRTAATKKASPKKKGATKGTKKAAGAKAKRGKASVKSSKNGKGRSKRIDPAIYGIGTSDFTFLKALEKTSPKSLMNHRDVKAVLGWADNTALPKMHFAPLLEAKLISDNVNPEYFAEGARGAHYYITAAGKKKIAQIEKALSKS